MTTDRQPQIFKAIKIEKPYEAIALIDGWLCIKYLDGGEESLSTFADVLKGDIIRFGHATPTSPPAPAPEYQKVEWLDGNGIEHKEITRLDNEHDAAIARKAREEAETTDNLLTVLRKRYRAEMAILDYIEMIECEVVSLKVESLRAQQAGGP